MEEFVLPYLKLNKEKLEEIPNVSLSPSNMFDKMSSMMDQKIIAAQVAADDVLIKMMLTLLSTPDLYTASARFV